MNTTDLIISVGAVLISLLIGLVGYLANRQLQKVDDKVSKIEGEFFDVKSKILEKPEIHFEEIITHLDKNILPQLQTKKLEDLVTGTRSDVTILKEYQRNKISPTLEKVLIMSDKLESQSLKQKESDEILKTMFDVVKRLVEKKERQN